MIEPAESLLFKQKEEFYKRLNAHYEVKPGKKVFTKEQQQIMIKEIQAAKIKQESKSRREYFLLGTYDVLSIKNEDFLIKKNKKDNTTDIKYVVSYEDLYELLYDIHVNSTGHGGHLKMRQALSNKFSVPRPAIEHFLATCASCNQKKGTPRKIVHPITSKDFNERGQVDLIDFQSLTDGPYKWILNYQDHSTKFVCLRALQNNTAKEIAKELLHIFLTFGAPKILQSDHGREFVNQTIKELKKLWPECVIVNGRPSHPHQSQGSVERCNQDVENMLRSWMTDNNSKQWSIGIQFVQWQKNISHHRIIGQSPYKAMFGSEPRVGLASSDIPNTLLNTLQYEEDLQNLYNELESAISTDIKTELDSESEPIIITTEDSHVENCENIGKYILDTPSVAQDSIVNEHSDDGAEELLSSEQEIKHERFEARAGRKRGAEQQMLKYSKGKQQKFCKNDCVLLSVPKIDRESADSSNLLAVVVDVQNGAHQVATPHGIIKGWFGSDSLQKATSNLLSMNEIVNNKSKSISLREAVSLTTSGGQGCSKCSCKPSKTQCNTKRCACFKMKTLCNSLCHTSLPCENK